MKPVESGIIVIVILLSLHLVIGIKEDVNVAIKRKNRKNLRLLEPEPKQVANRSGNLLLTPLIESGRVLEARNQARVRNLVGASGIESYSGLFTVNSKYNSNLYFWFFPAKSKPEKAPLLVWLQGGPGASSLYGLFVEHGPFYIDKSMKLNIRTDYAWTLTHSMIYFDNPVGVGFSYTDKDSGYARNEADVAQDLYSALSQFYKVFPEYIPRDLYITGESFAGRYVPSLTFKIHTENRNPLQLQKMTLKGFIVANGLSDPYNMMHYSEVLSNIGLIDENERLQFKQKEDLIRSLIIRRRWVSAFNEFERLILGDVMPYPTYFYNTTGFTNYYNFLYSSNETQSEMYYFEDFVQQTNVRQALHVGNQPYLFVNVDVEKYLIPDYMKSEKIRIQKLLDASEGYRLFFYTGQLDLSIPYTATAYMLRKLDWSGSAQYLAAKKTIWRGGGKDILGYARQAKNLQFLLIRNAGHIAPFDQPAALFSMINTFTAGKPFE